MIMIIYGVNFNYTYLVFGTYTDRRYVALGHRKHSVRNWCRSCLYTVHTDGTDEARTNGAAGHASASHFDASPY